MVSLWDDLLHIAGRASTVAERLRTDFHPDEHRTSEQCIDARLERWCQIVAAGNWELFVKRLTWDGLDVDAVRRALCADRLAHDEPLPAWAETLAQVMHAAIASQDVESAGMGARPEYDSDDPLPFEDLIISFVEVARQRLHTRIGARHQLLSATAQAQLERSLLLRLAGLSAEALELEFSVFRAARRSSLDRLLARSAAAPRSDHYRAFITHIRGDGLRSFFREYSMLARLMAMVTNFWIDSAAELIERLAADWGAIQHTFGDRSASELGQVVAVEANLSDRHNRGRSVIALTFASGLKVIYKPKNLGLEAAYFDLLTWFNAHGTTLPWKLLRVIDRSNYGWIEYVEHQPCQHPDEVRRYYQRAGMLLCLVYALEGTDCHHENLIACGEYPVLVDMETLLHHRIRKLADHEEQGTASYLANQQLANSVLRTGFLPRWETGPDRRGAYDISGFGSIGDQSTSFRVLGWKHVNTDQMTLQSEYAGVRAQANTPTLHGIAQTPEEYHAELIAGFGQMYSFLVEWREALTATDGPLATLAKQYVRIVFRATKAYGAVLQQIVRPQLLRDGADYSIELDILYAPFLSSNPKPIFWPLVTREKESLEQVDIPYFAARADGATLTVMSEQGTEQTIDALQGSSYHRVLARLQQFDEADLAQQISLIQSSLYVRVARQARADAAAQPADLDTWAITMLTQAELTEHAGKVAHELQRRAIRAADGSASWIGLAYMREAERFQLQPMGVNLYNGGCGIALFLAALEHVTGGAGFRNLALGALHTIQSVLRNSTPTVQQKFAQQVGIGGAVGLGSIVYALVRCSQWLHEPSLMEDARAVAMLITLEGIAADRHLDVIGGAAGAILGLLALYDHAPAANILERAIDCGEQLLSQRVASQDGHRVWSTLDSQQLTGFSHGAAGIAYALLRLYAVTDDLRFRQAAEEALVYQRSVFVPEAGNWPAHRVLDGDEAKPEYMTAWCHGATGIGLARLGGLPVLDSADIRYDIDTAVQTTQGHGLAALDHLCCGNFGRIELLLEAGRRLDRPQLLATAYKQAASIVNRAQTSGAFHLFADLPHGVFAPGFFQGTAGIGYELLRLAYPDRLPSVLLWE